jgi:predicted  nucleic acid-binding Zn-ribbon protein
MHKDMNRLHELQQIDTAISELQADLRALDDGSALRERVAAAEQELERRRGSHHDNHAVQSKKEAELEKADGKRKALMAKAYGGTIANPKELETLEKEIAALGRTKDRLENELLELFDTVDAENQAVREQEKLIDQLKAELGRVVETYEAERTRLAGEVETLRQEREQVSASVAPESLETYERIRGRSGHLGVAVIQGRVCTACRVNLPIVQIARLIEGRDFERCESCMRLLWIEREPDTDADDSTSAAE